MIALEQSLLHGTDRASYAAEADVSVPTARTDLRRLVDAGLIRRQRREPANRYAASDQLARDLRR
jgi:DNA-binding transcriptional regulator PaaX